MISLQELSRYLEDLLSCSLFTDYCINGLQVEGKQKINKIATAVSASYATIEQAVNLNIDALIVHHGIFWNRDSYAIAGVKKEKLALLLENKISLLAYHLPLDAHKTFGNNWKAANDLGWQNLEPFCSIGVKGQFNEVAIEEFRVQIQNYYQHPAHVALGGNKTVKSAALISGGAYKNVVDAAYEGVDCYITGNFDEPAWHHAFEEKINFFALGHSATERVAPQALGMHLQQHFLLDYQFIDIINPF